GGQQAVAFEPHRAGRRTGPGDAPHRLHAVRRPGQAGPGARRAPAGTIERRGAGPPAARLAPGGGAADRTLEGGGVTGARVDAERVKGRVRARLVGGRGHAELDALPRPERWLRVREEVLSVLREERAILASETLTDVINQVSDEVVGLGPV